jgi:hypothetical protein
MPTEALGSAKEAHRQWPEGRSEQGASKAKYGPSHGGALPRERDMVVTAALTCRLRCISY